ncbi:MAG: class I SAM-dependent methyltransferase [Nostoc sp.]
MLDAAVGTGLNLSAYPVGINVVGIDLSEKMLDEARIRRHHFQSIGSLQS